MQRVEASESQPSESLSPLSTGSVEKNLEEELLGTSGVSFRCTIKDHNTYSFVGITPIRGFTMVPITHVSISLGRQPTQRHAIAVVKQHQP